MGFLSKKKQEDNSSNCVINLNIEMVKPFSVLANSQFSRFVAELSNEHNQDISQLLTVE